MLIDRRFAEHLPQEDSSPDPGERRAAVRLPVEADVTVRGDGRILSGLSADVSVGGMFVASYHSLPTGSRVSLRFRLPTGQILATGVVRWLRTGRPGKLAGMGVEFAEIDEDDRESLRRFCGDRPKLLSYEQIVEKTR